VYICICRAVSEQDIVEVSNKNKNADLKTIKRETGLGSQCGKCESVCINLLKNLNGEKSKC